MTLDEVFYDPECETLAAHFLQDESPEGQAVYESRLRSLASEIQRAVEGWFDGNPAETT